MNEKEQCIRRAASVVSKIIKKLKKETKPGDTGLILDQIAKKIMKEENVYSSSLNYNGFPSSICVSVNDQLTHGIPTNIPFKNGDLISVDVACNYNGYHADAATTFVVGNLENNKITRDKIDNLLNVTKNSLHFAIMSIRPGKTTNQEIGEIINKYVSSRGLYTISEYGGHGIGRKLHEEPFIPNKKIKFLEPFVIKEGMYICIEPLVQFNDGKVILSDDNWTVISKNGNLNAHFEHTIKINKNDVEILTNYE